MRKITGPGTIVQIGGTNCVGKTTIAQRFADTHPGSVVFIDGVHMLHEIVKEHFGKQLAELSESQKRKARVLLREKLTANAAWRLVVLEGHFTVVHGEGDFTPSDFGVKPDALILVSPPSEEHVRLFQNAQSLDPKPRVLSLKTAIRRAEAEMRFAKALAESRGIPLHVITSSPNDAAAEAHKILEGYLAQVNQIRRSAQVNKMIRMGRAQLQEPEYEEYALQKIRRKPPKRKFFKYGERE